MLRIYFAAATRIPSDIFNSVSCRVWHKRLSCCKTPLDFDEDASDEDSSDNGYQMGCDDEEVSMNARTCQLSAQGRPLMSALTPRGCIDSY